MSTSQTNAANQPSLGPLAVRGAFGGLLMGLANLVPGISGGTMLLAAGIYPRFIAAVAEVTTFKFRKPSLILLACVVAAALLAILLLAGMVRDLVVHHRWIMYSLFIGLTLGGVPVVWRMVTRSGMRFWLGALSGLAIMIALALWKASGDGSSAANTGVAMMLLAGIAGASAMILPGISGGYLWLVLGVYVPILSGIEAVKQALSVRDVALLSEPFLTIVLPVGFGVVIGIALVSNLLKWVLARYRDATLGVLMGLLVGAVVGLWPFQQGVAPQPGDIIKGQVVTTNATGELILTDTGKTLEAKDYPTATFSPATVQIVGSVVLVLLGFAGTVLIARFSPDDSEP